MTESREIRVITLLSAGMVFFLAAAAFVLSYEALHQLALSNGISPTLAWLFPLVVDGAMITASLAVMRNSLLQEHTLYQWGLVGLFTAASIVFNVLHAQDNLLARVIGGTAPVSLFLGYELLMGQIRSNVTRRSVAASLQDLERKGTELAQQLRDLEAQIAQAGADIAQAAADLDAKRAQIAQEDAAARAAAAQRDAELARLAAQAEQDWKARAEAARKEAREAQTAAKEARQQRDALTQEIEQLRMERERAADQRESNADPAQPAQEERSARITPAAWRAICAGLNGQRAQMTADAVNEILSARGFAPLKERTAQEYAKTAREMAQVEN